jgi:hypothetical protein
MHTSHGVLHNTSDTVKDTRLGILEHQRYQDLSIQVTRKWTSRNQCEHFGNHLPALLISAVRGTRFDSVSSGNSISETYDFQRDTHACMDTPLSAASNRLNSLEFTDDTIREVSRSLFTQELQSSVCIQLHTLGLECDLHGSQLIFANSKLPVS